MDNSSKLEVKCIHLSLQELYNSILNALTFLVSTPTNSAANGFWEEALMNKPVLFSLERTVR
jgi:hypothetical protein